MKIYGFGTLDYPGTSRVVWDFEDGPFDTCNEILIEAAKLRGFSFTAPADEVVIPRKLGRPKKEVKNEHPKNN